MEWYKWYIVTIILYSHCNDNIGQMGSSTYRKVCCCSSCCAKETRVRCCRQCYISRLGWLLSVAPVWGFLCRIYIFSFRVAAISNEIEPILLLQLWCPFFKEDLIGGGDWCRQVIPVILPLVAAGCLMFIVLFLTTCMLLGNIRSSSLASAL